MSLQGSSRQPWSLVHDKLARGIDIGHQGATSSENLQDSCKPIEY